MKRRVFFSIVIFLFCAGGYFLFFYQNKKLNYIPSNADVVVLVDTKKLMRQYISEFLAHPSEWFKKDDTKDYSVSWDDSGLKMPDFIEVFHLKNTELTEWYSVFEIKDKNGFLTFLRNRNFKAEGKNKFQKDSFYILINEGLCIISTKNIQDDSARKILKSFRKELDADDFIEGTVAGISFIDGVKTEKFSVFLNDNEIEVTNTDNAAQFSSLISDFKKSAATLEAELDGSQIRTASRFLGKDWEKSGIDYFKISATLEEVQDTIISYGYDDNFNEIEKVTFQKLVQPNYIIQLKTDQTEKAISYFNHKKWVNSQKQFTAIPFQPNFMEENNNGVVIKSTRKPLQISAEKKQNFIYLKNDPLLFSSFKTINTADKAVLKDIRYFFYGISQGENYFKIQFKEHELPLLLR